MTDHIPGWEGSVGPFPAQYGQPHVYARDVHSGAGNCVCGAALHDPRHVQAAPGVPIPDGLRQRPAAMRGLDRVRAAVAAARGDEACPTASITWAASVDNACAPITIHTFRTGGSEP